MSGFVGIIFREILESISITNAEAVNIAFQTQGLKGFSRQSESIDQTGKSLLVSTILVCFPSQLLPNVAAPIMNLILIAEYKRMFALVAP